MTTYQRIAGGSVFGGPYISESVSVDVQLPVGGYLNGNPVFPASVNVYVPTASIVLTPFAPTLANSSPVYAKSTTGSDANDGLSWATAKATFAGAIAIAKSVPYTIIYLSQAHSESVSVVNQAAAGTGVLPIQAFGANDGAAPPTVSSTAPIIQANGNITLNIGTSLYCYGLQFQAGASSGGLGSTITGYQTTTSNPTAFTAFDSCAFRLLVGIGSSIRFNIAVSLVNCAFNFVSNTSTIYVGGLTTLRACSLENTSVSPSTLFKTFASGEVSIEGFDLSAADSSVNILDSDNLSGGQAVCNVTFTHCKLPSGWSGSFLANAAHVIGAAVIEFINCSSTGTNYQYLRQTALGSVTADTTVTVSGGNSDGTTAFSWKIVSNSSPIFPMLPLITENIFAWNDTVGSTVTATVEIASAATTFNNDEVYLAIIYLGDSGSPLGTYVTNARALLASAASQPTSTASWSGSSLGGSPVKQKLSVSFTPQLAGYVIGRVLVAKASSTLWVNPQLTLS